MMKSVVLVFLLALTASFAVSATAKDIKAKDKTSAKTGEVKELSGISIMGNKEAPKSLFIVPWKSSEIGVETGLTSSLLNEKLKTVDKDVFTRELDYYSTTIGK